MPKLPRVTAGEVVRALRRAGFAEDHQTGSHLSLRHSSGCRVVVPRHGKTLGTGLTHAILEQACLSVEEFIELLK
jgi:predicted RNA binding protein YcfA (HicA-like mRNA interferase family)